MCQLCTKQSDRSPNHRLLTKRSPAVGGIISRLLDKLTTVLKRWHDRILEALRERQIDPKIPGSVQPRVTNSFEPTREDFEATIREMWNQGARAGREAAIRRHSLDVPTDITRRRVRNELNRNGNIASSYASNRMISDISTSIVEASRDGYSREGIIDALDQQVFDDMRGYESRRITETETFAASSRGSLSAFEMSPGVSQKRWIAIDDSRTRTTHRAADGQTVPIGSKFEVGGEAASYPGDPRLSAKERINCRCWVIGVMV